MTRGLLIACNPNLRKVSSKQVDRLCVLLSPPFSWAHGIFGASCIVRLLLSMRLLCAWFSPPSLFWLIACGGSNTAGSRRQGSLIAAGVRALCRASGDNFQHRMVKADRCVAVVWLCEEVEPVWTNSLLYL